MIPGRIAESIGSCHERIVISPDSVMREIFSNFSAERILPDAEVMMRFIIENLEFRI
jgi:hypothetical protein